MNCWWGNQSTISTLVVGCSEEVSTAFISGFVSFAIEEDLDGDNYLAICGRNIILNSGHDLHDTLIPTLTQSYNCYNAYENKLGNEFDWIWDPGENILQMIWRPENEKDKVLTLFIEKESEAFNVLGSVYYKTGYFN